MIPIQYTYHKTKSLLLFLLLIIITTACSINKKVSHSLKTNSNPKAIKFTTSPLFLNIQEEHLYCFASNDSAYLLNISTNKITAFKKEEEMEFNTKGDLQIEGNLGYNFLYITKGKNRLKYKVKLPTEFSTNNFCFNNLLFPPFLSDDKTIIGFNRAKTELKIKNPFQLSFLNINNTDTTITFSKTIDYTFPNLKANNYYTFPELVHFNDSVYFSMGISPAFFNINSNKLYDFENEIYKSAQGFEVSKTNSFNDASIYSKTNPSYSLAGKYNDYFVFEYKAPLPLTDSILNQQKPAFLLFMKSPKEYIQIPMPTQLVNRSVKIYNNQLYYATYNKETQQLLIHSAAIVAN